MSFEDDILLDAAARKDQDALGTIFDKYSPLIYKYSLRICRDVSQADDIVGEVFMRLAANLQKGKLQIDNLKSYLYQIAYHLVVDQYRKEERITELEEGTILPDHSLPISKTVENKALMESIYSALQKNLTADQQHVIILRFIEGFSIAETAEITGKTTSNVKVIQSRGMEKLRTALVKTEGFLNEQ